MAKNIQNAEVKVEDGEVYVYSYMFRRGDAPFCQSMRTFNGTVEQTLEYLRQTKPIPMHAYSVRVYRRGGGEPDLPLTEVEINQFRQ